ncbi:hypothetical protein M5X11_29395 [Paenibacillus alginolyticus]|uniref:hypothetical protein n=1 Tax=Paenibacillus alginolyticus TaxID=59839 RepID=UPI0004066CD3|nr:hypothetical protein [Paenibacillus alginolyticus]MCY9668991.1 hypothetical protein [Paenibacillus alginolyticus]
MAKHAPTKILNWFRGQIAVKMTSSILLLLLFVCAAFSVSGYLTSKSLTTKLEDQFVLRLTTNIENVSKYLTSIPEHADEITGKDKPAYTKIKQQFEQFKKQDSLENVYVLQKVQNKDQIVILTGVDEDYGSEYPFTPEMNNAIKENKLTISEIYKDEFGIHKSVFVPLKNGKGENVGIVGIDLDASSRSQDAARIVMDNLYDYLNRYRTRRPDWLFHQPKCDATGHSIDACN